MWTIAADTRITRRQSVHYVIGPDGCVHFTTPRFTDAIRWLIGAEVHAASIDDGKGDPIAIEFTRVLPE